MKSRNSRADEGGSDPPLQPSMDFQGAKKVVAPVALVRIVMPRTV
jgi:hypothetical protein